MQVGIQTDDILIVTKKGHYTPVVKFAVKYLTETAEIWTNPLKNTILPRSTVEFDGYKIATSKDALTLGMTDLNGKKLKKLIKRFESSKELKDLANLLDLAGYTAVMIPEITPLLSVARRILITGNAMQISRRKYELTQQKISQKEGFEKSDIEIGLQPLLIKQQWVNTISTMISEIQECKHFNTKRVIRGSRQCTEIILTTTRDNYKLYINKVEMIIPAVHAWKQIGRNLDILEMRVLEELQCTRQTLETTDTNQNAMQRICKIYLVLMTIAAVLQKGQDIILITDRPELDLIDRNKIEEVLQALLTQIQEKRDQRYLIKIITKRLTMSIIDIKVNVERVIQPNPILIEDTDQIRPYDTEEEQRIMRILNQNAPIFENDSFILKAKINKDKTLYKNFYQEEDLLVLEQQCFSIAAISPYDRMGSIQRVFETLDNIVAAFTTSQQEYESLTLTFTQGQATARETATGIAQKKTAMTRIVGHLLEVVITKSGHKKFIMSEQAAVADCIQHVRHFLPHVVGIIDTILGVLQIMKKREREYLIEIAQIRQDRQTSKDDLINYINNAQLQQLLIKAVRIHLVTYHQLYLSKRTVALECDTIQELIQSAKLVETPNGTIELSTTDLMLKEYTAEMVNTIKSEMLELTIQEKESISKAKEKGVKQYTFMNTLHQEQIQNKIVKHELQVHNKQQYQNFLEIQGEKYATSEQIQILKSETARVTALDRYLPELDAYASWALPQHVKQNLQHAATIARLANAQKDYAQLKDYLNKEQFLRIQQLTNLLDRNLISQKLMKNTLENFKFKNRNMIQMELQRAQVQQLSPEEEMALQEELTDLYAAKPHQQEENQEDRNSQQEYIRQNQEHTAHIRKLQKLEQQQKAAKSLAQQNQQRKVEKQQQKIQTEIIDFSMFEEKYKDASLQETENDTMGTVEVLEEDIQEMMHFQDEDDEILRRTTLPLQEERNREAMLVEDFNDMEDDLVISDKWQPDHLAQHGFTTSQNRTAVLKQEKSLQVTCSKRNYEKQAVEKTTKLMKRQNTTNISRKQKELISSLENLRNDNKEKDTRLISSNIKRDDRVMKHQQEENKEFIFHQMEQNNREEMNMGQDDFLYDQTIQLTFKESELEQNSKTEYPAQLWPELEKLEPRLYIQNQQAELKQEETLEQKQRRIKTGVRDLSMPEITWSEAMTSAINIAGKNIKDVHNEKLKAIYELAQKLSEEDVRKAYFGCFDRMITNSTRRRERDNTATLQTYQILEVARYLPGWVKIQQDIEGGNIDFLEEYRYFSKNCFSVQRNVINDDLIDKQKIKAEELLLKQKQQEEEKRPSEEESEDEIQVFTKDQKAVKAQNPIGEDINVTNSSRGIAKAREAETLEKAITTNMISNILIKKLKKHLAVLLDIKVEQLKHWIETIYKTGYYSLGLKIARYLYAYEVIMNDTTPGETMKICERIDKKRRETIMKVNLTYNEKFFSPQEDQMAREYNTIHEWDQDTMSKIIAQAAESLKGQDVRKKKQIKLDEQVQHYQDEAAQDEQQQESIILSSQNEGIQIQEHQALPSRVQKAELEMSYKGKAKKTYKVTIKTKPRDQTLVETEIDYKTYVRSALGREPPIQTGRIKTIDDWIKKNQEVYSTPSIRKEKRT